MTLMEWISTRNELPRKGEEVFACASFHFGGIIFDKELKIAYVDMYGEWTLSDLPEAESVVVTHWMPMPEPPKEKLKPCPFCGCEEPTTKIDQWDKWTVYCTDCSATIDDFYTEKEAIKAWNTRAGAENE